MQNIVLRADLPSTFPIITDRNRDMLITGRRKPVQPPGGILSFILTILTGIGGLILCLVLYGCGKPKGGSAALIGMILAIVVGVALIIVYFMLLASVSTTTILCQIVG